MTRASEYLSYILAILVVNTRHFIPLCKRVRITSVSMPTIFHAEAWREYQGLSREYMNLVMLTNELSQEAKGEQVNGYANHPDRQRHLHQEVLRAEWWP